MVFDPDDENRWYVVIARKLAALDGRRRSLFVTGDICDEHTAATLRDGSPSGYDAVICQSVYHHIEDKDLFWRQLASFCPTWVVLEGPVDRPSCLLTGTWGDEKAFLRREGYEVTFESSDNDYPDRVLARLPAKWRLTAA